jgi:hypothetical protein
MNGSIDYSGASVSGDEIDGANSVSIWGGKARHYVTVLGDVINCASGPSVLGEHFRYCGEDANNRGRTITESCK